MNYRIFFISILLCGAAKGSGFRDKPLFYGIDTQVGLEIVNKNHNPIWVAVKNGDTRYERDGIDFFKIDGRLNKERSMRDFEIDINKPTTLAIWYSIPRLSRSSSRGPIDDEKIFSLADQVYTFRHGKTLYLSWDKKTFIRPQTGAYNGMSKRTVSLLSLVTKEGVPSNITTLDITRRK